MLFKRNRIPFTIPDDARELTEEEMIQVNGGSERRENSNEGVAGADVGDTIQRNDGTVVTLSQGDIDYAKAQLEKEGTSPTPSATPTNSPTPSNNTPPSPTSINKTNDATANTVKGPNHHSAYDQQFINEMMEKEQKSAVGGNGIQGTAVSRKAVKGNQTTANQGAGTMTVTDYIAQQRKMGAGATVPGQAAKTSDEKVKEAVAKIGKKDYIVGEYQCDQYVNEIVEKAGYDPKDFYLDDPSGKTVDKHISDLIASGKSYSTAASSLLPGSYVVFMSDDDKLKNSHAALLVVENGAAYIQDNSSHNNATAWNECGKAIAWAGGTEKTLDISATAVCNQFTGYENFYFQRII